MVNINSRFQGYESNSFTFWWLVLKKKKQFHQMSKHKRARCLHMTDKPVNEDDVQYSQIYS